MRIKLRGGGQEVRTASRTERRTALAVSVLNETTRPRKLPRTVERSRLSSFDALTSVPLARSRVSVH